MRLAIRGVRGPHAGSVFVVEGPITFGRAADVDIQVVDDTVSRQHARLKLEAGGRAVLMDLRSKEGTFVGSERIERKELTIGDRFRIGEAEYVLEVSQDQGFASAPVFEFKTQGHETLIATRVRAQPSEVRLTRVQTVRVSMPRGADEIAAPSSAPGSEGVDAAAGAPVVENRFDPGPPEVSSQFGSSLPEGQTLDISALDAPALDDGIRGAAGADLELEGEAETLVVDPATLADLVQFRSLRHRIEEGDDVREYDRLRLQALERRFREGDPDLSANRRQWRRFHCAAPGEATLFRNLSSRTVPIRVADLGAGGLRFFAPDLAFGHGDVLSVLLHVDARTVRHAVFSARIVWVNQVAFSFGATFCGAARLDRPAMA